MNETEFQNKIIDTAHLYGWKVAHFRKARTKDGWRTPVGADGKGFPDLVLVHAKWGLIKFVEVKTDGTYPTDDQRAWLGWLAEAGQNVDVWKPRNWTAILEYLSRGKAVE